MMNNEEPTEQQPYNPSPQEVIDYHLLCAGSAALELASQEGHPIFTHSSSDLRHKLTNESRSVFTLIYAAGENTNEVGQRIAHYARELLKISPENKEANSD